jgi:4-hydroxy-tetrahydrodipicolinate synthase
LEKKIAKKVHGLFPALLTPFDSKGRVDRDALAGLVRFQISKGADGLYPCGSTGLGPLLGFEERKEIAETVIQEARRKVPVVVQVGCADTPTTAKLAQHAEDAGAYAVASLTPFYYKAGESSMAKHFETIASKIQVPLFAYNIPQFTGNNLKPEAVTKLARNGTISGVKDSSRDVLQLLELLNLVPDDFVVMNGTEEYALFAIMMGGDGVVSGGANAWPELFHTLVSSAGVNDHAGATAAQRKILAFKDAVSEAPIPFYYEILRERGMDCGDPRAPFLPVGKKMRAGPLEKLRALGLPLSAKD